MDRVRIGIWVHRAVQKAVHEGANEGPVAQDEERALLTTRLEGLGGGVTALLEDVREDNVAGMDGLADRLEVLAVAAIVAAATARLVEGRLRWEAMRRAR